MITGFSRRVALQVTQRAAAVGLLAVVGCANHAAAPPPAPPAAAAAADDSAVVVAVRPVAALRSGDVRSLVIGALGAAPRGGDSGAVAADAAVEVILSEPDGRTVSLVQTGAQGLRAGDRVLMRVGTRTSVERAQLRSAGVAGAAVPGG
jgi:hypothetical protein